MVRPLAQPAGPVSALTAADVGRRVVVRHALPDGRATDVLGRLESWAGGVLVVRRGDGSLVTVPERAVLAAKPVPPGPVRVRSARPDDAAPVESLRVATWRVAYRGMVPDGYLDAMSGDAAGRAARLADPGPGVVEMVAESADAIVGWAVGGPSRDDDATPSVGEVYACYVNPGWWGSGVGGRLLRRVLHGLGADGREEVRLWVLAGNERAQRFYAGHGFAPDGTEVLLDLGAPVAEIRWVRPG